MKDEEEAARSRILDHEKIQKVQTSLKDETVTKMKVDLD